MHYNLCPALPPDPSSTAYHVGLTRLLQRQNGVLGEHFGLLCNRLCDLTHKALEGRLEQQQLCGLLVLFDLPVTGTAAAAAAAAAAGEGGGGSRSSTRA